MQSIRRFSVLALIAAATSLLSAAPAYAWDGVVTGKISELHVTSAENYGLRVFLEGAGGSLCTGGPNWAYINKSWDNYEAAVAMLTSAWLAGKDVTLYTNTVGTYCEIGYLRFR